MVKDRGLIRKKLNRVASYILTRLQYIKLSVAAHVLENVWLIWTHG